MRNSIVIGKLTIYRPYKRGVADSHLGRFEVIALKPSYAIHDQYFFFGLGHVLHIAIRRG